MFFKKIDVVIVNIKFKEFDAAVKDLSGCVANGQG